MTITSLLIRGLFLLEESKREEEDIRSYLREEDEQNDIEKKTRRKCWHKDFNELTRKHK